MVSRYAGRSSSDTTPASSMSSTSAWAAHAAHTRGNQLRAFKTQRVEGSVTRIFYVGPADRSPLEIVRNYELELTKNRFGALLHVRRNTVRPTGRLAGALLSLYPEETAVSTPPPGVGRQVGQVSEYALATPVNQRYLAMERARPEGDVYVSVYVATNRFTLHKETQDHPVILLDSSMRCHSKPGWSRSMPLQWPKTFRPPATWRSMASTSTPTKRTSSLIAASPRGNHEAAETGHSLKLFIVGHTDNVGAQRLQPRPVGAPCCRGRERTDGEARNSGGAAETGGRRHAVAGRTERQ